MSTNGLSLYNVGSSLDLDALTQHGGGRNIGHEEESDGDDEMEMQQRNTELQNLLANGFDDLIDDESDLEASNNGFSQYSSNSPSRPLRHHFGQQPEAITLEREYALDSMYSPVRAEGAEELTTTQYDGMEESSEIKKLPILDSSKTTCGQANACAKFSPSKKDKVPMPVSQGPWNGGDNEEQEKHYLSSGLNSHTELEILYSARGVEISKLAAELHQYQHKTALLEAEKAGVRATIEASERVLRESRDENRRLKDEIEALNQRVNKLTDDNEEISAKLEAAENNTVSLERQILDLNLFQANHRDANRQEVLLNGIKARYENDLRVLRDELNRLRSELDSKNDSISNLERKLRDVTEMHDRTLTERAANLQEFNRALDQQRFLREQRDTLTSATLLDQLSKAQEEIERLKSERLSQNLSDSMSQMRLTTSHKDHMHHHSESRDFKQVDRIISSLESRLQASETGKHRLEDTIRQLEKDRETLRRDLATLREAHNSSRGTSSETEKLQGELANVKELYLAVCKEKDALENQLQKRSSELSDVEVERKQLLRDLEEVNSHMEDNLKRHKAMIEANMDAKMQAVVQEQVARARLEWLREKAEGQTDDLVHVEKSLGELQCLREAMDALRQERDALQNELIHRQQQLKLERHLLHEKFTIEKEMLVKNWQEKLNTVASDKSDSQLGSRTLITATADAMARLRQQCEEEKMSIIANYEKQLLDLQSGSSAGRAAVLTTSSTSNNIQSDSPVSDWRTDMSKVKIGLHSNKSVPADVLYALDSAIHKAELSWLQDQRALQDQSDKYKQLKRRVRDYQKYVGEKMAKYKIDRQQSEDYCRHVISELLNKVTNELQQLEPGRCNPTSAIATPQPTIASAVGHPRLRASPGSNFAQSIDDLQQQVHRYVQGLGNLNAFAK